MSKQYNAQMQHSRSFYNYISRIGNARSRLEEDMIVTSDLKELKTAFAEPHIEPELMKEYIIRACYAEMLGHRATFAHIHFVNMSSSTLLMNKRTGYMATWLCIHPDDELMYLMVATIQRDLKSDNYLEISAALSAAAKLLRMELMPVVSEAVVGLLPHQNPLVRKKAVEAMHAFYIKSEGTIGDHQQFRQVLCDRDPSVMNAAVRLLCDVTRLEPNSQVDLFESFLTVLVQVIQRRLPREYDYHRIPSPWLQMRLIRLLAVLAADSPQLAKRCEPVFTEVVTRADNGHRIGIAIICDVIAAVARMPPVLPSLVSLAGQAVARFLSPSSSGNLRYTGIQALTELVRLDSDIAVEHQVAIMECLEATDETIRRKAVTLLLAITDESNVDAIARRLVKFVARTSNEDDFLRRNTVNGLCYIIERYAPGVGWYVAMMNKVLLAAPLVTPPLTLQRMLKRIAEGDGQSEEADSELRAACVETYFTLTNATEASEALLKVGAWVMGEYGFLTRRVSRAMLLDRLCDLLEFGTDKADTRCWIVSGMMKLVAQGGGLSDEQAGENGIMPSNVAELVQRFTSSRSVDLQQRCYEFLALACMPSVMHAVLPLDGCCEEISVDPTLGFMNNFVAEALRAGSKAYRASASAQVAPVEKQASQLKVAAYEPASRPAPMFLSMDMLGTSGSNIAVEPASIVDPRGREEQSLDWLKADDVSRLTIGSGSNGRKRWGRAEADTAASNNVAKQQQQQETVASDPFANASRFGSEGSVVALAKESQLQQQGLELGSSVAANTTSAEVLPVPSTQRHVKDAKFMNNVFGTRKKVSSRRAEVVSKQAKVAEKATHNMTSANSTLSAANQRLMNITDALFDFVPSSGNWTATAGSTITGSAATLRSAQSAATMPQVASSIDPFASLDATTPLFDERATSPSPPSPRMNLMLSREPTATRCTVTLQPSSSLSSRDFSPLGTMRVTITIPPQFAFQQLHCTSPGANVSNSGSCERTVDVPWSALSPLQVPNADPSSITIEATLIAASATPLRMGSSIVSTVSLSTSLEPMATQSISCSILDLLRPAAGFTTSLFGSLWASSHSERQLVEVKGTVSAASLQRPMTVEFLRLGLARYAALHVVEVIGNELIAAAMLVGFSPLPGEEHRSVLCHCAVGSSGEVCLAVRSAYREVGAEVLRVLSSGLQTM